MLGTLSALTVSLFTAARLVMVASRDWMLVREGGQRGATWYTLANRWEPVLLGGWQRARAHIVFTLPQAAGSSPAG